MGIPGEVADTLVTILESAPVQTALEAAVNNGELTLETVIDNIISNIKAGGALGLLISATKGTVETELNAAIKQYTPAQIVALFTKAAQDEAKALGG